MMLPGAWCMHVAFNFISDMTAALSHFRKVSQTNSKYDSTLNFIVFRSDAVYVVHFQSVAMHKHVCLFVS